MNEQCLLKEDTASQQGKKTTTEASSIWVNGGRGGLQWPGQQLGSQKSQWHPVPTVHMAEDCTELTYTGPWPWQTPVVQLCSDWPAIHGTSRGISLLQNSVHFFNTSFRNVCTVSLACLKLPTVGTYVSLNFCRKESRCMNKKILFIYGNLKKVR